MYKTKTPVPYQSYGIRSRNSVDTRPGQALKRHSLSKFALIVVVILLAASFLLPGHIFPLFNDQNVVYNPCKGNTLAKLVLVSISSRHLWACNNENAAFDSPVVTGISYLAADLTPTGTYHIFAKVTNTHLIGHDSTGSWNDFVYYWMPWLSNRYGEYGFHDATWRPLSAFGNVTPNSSNASHGCVEMPLAGAKQLFGWVDIGTTVKIVS